MSDATSGAMSSIIDSAPLIKKIRINKMLFPLEKVVFSLLNFAISLVAVAAVIAFFQIPLTWNILLLPLLLFYIFLFCLGLGLLLSSLAVFFRDVMHSLGARADRLDVRDASVLLPPASSRTGCGPSCSSIPCTITSPISATSPSTA